MTERLSRRKFAEVLAAGSLLGMAVPAGAEEGVAEVTADDAGEVVAGPEKAAAAARRMSPVDHTLEIIRQTYPHANLKEESLEEIEADLAYFAYRTRQLSQFPLSNADEPGFVFAAWRSDLGELLRPES